MATQSEILTKIAAIDAKIQSGVRQVMVDGTMTTLDLPALRLERIELEKQLTDHRSRRPYSSRIELGGF